MNNKPTPAESAHLARVKALPCSLCGAPPPSQAHHIKQHAQYTTVSLCPDCHGGPGYPNGWHGSKVLWSIRKMDELDALDVTLRMLETGKSQREAKYRRPSKTCPRRLT